MKCILRSQIITIVTILSAATMTNEATAYTWHTVRTSAGEWTANIGMINEAGFFVNRKGERINSFLIDANHSYDFGFGFDDNADFNIAYSLTVVQNEKVKQFTSKACVFIITATAPAKPDIKTMSYNGAKCDSVTVPHQGVDFNVV